jgi:hypothetical protein
MKFRWTALVAFVASTLAFALSTALLVAGNRTNLGQGHFWLAVSTWTTRANDCLSTDDLQKQVNTSRTGQDLIQVSTATDGATNDLVNIPVVGDLFAGVVDGINGAIDLGLQDLQGQILGNLTQQLGLRDVYRFFLGGICEGDFENEEDPESGVNIDACYSYSANRGLLHLAPGDYLPREVG